MKKFFLSAFLAVSMVGMAQHVTPLSVQITEVKLDSLRTLYQAEPPMYRTALEMLASNLAKDADELKVAKTQLKAEKAHAKEMGNSLKDATKMTAALKQIYGKEESELKSMQKTVEKQQKTLAKQKELNKETRDNYQSLLEKQQKELGYALREVAERQRVIADLETTIQNARTRLQTFVQETERKDFEITQLEAQLKERSAIVKTEQKSAKNMQ